MAEISKLNISELDFDTIKANLKDYFNSQVEFTDHNFGGSAISVLLDILAYNTHYNAMAAHLALNEAFLDSAQIRGNAVSRARISSSVRFAKSAFSDKWNFPSIGPAYSGFAVIIDYRKYIVLDGFSIEVVVSYVFCDNWKQNTSAHQLQYEISDSLGI